MQKKKKTERKWKNRLLSFAVATAMTLSMLPVTAFADETTGSNQEDTTASGTCTCTVKCTDTADAGCALCVEDILKCAANQDTSDQNETEQDAANECETTKSIAGESATSQENAKESATTQNVTTQGDASSNTADQQESVSEASGETNCAHGISSDECGICKVQAAIDALPSADDVTEDNMESVMEQLSEIDTLKIDYDLTDEEYDELNTENYSAVIEKIYQLQGLNGALQAMAVDEEETESESGTKSWNYVDENGETQTQDNFTVLTTEYLTEKGYKLSAGWYVVGETDAENSDSTVTASERIVVSGNVNLILANGYTLNAEKGINVSNGNSLTIYGQDAGSGALTARGGDKQAGIGGGENESAGTITINGGTVTATGGNFGAGIGGGYNGSGGAITINDGTVVATGGAQGAGIGGGNWAGCGVIIINGGKVTASSIGTGSDGFDGAITINGGEVNTTGECSGPGIGGAGEMEITIKDGKVTAIGDEWAVGIGGTGGKGANIIISGGIVTATGGRYSAAIGATGGSGGKNDTFSTGTNGTAFITASSIGDESYKDNSDTSGIFFIGNECTVYGNPILSSSLNIGNGQTLTIQEGATLTVAEGVTITNKGTITNNGTLINNGTIDSIDNENNQPLINNGTIANNGTIEPEFTDNSTSATYIGADGGKHTVYGVTELSLGNLMHIYKYTLSSGWYVIDGSTTDINASTTIEVGTRIKVSGDVHLILTDGCTLNATKGINVSERNSLTIYGQENQTGALTINSVDNYNAGIGGDINEKAGTITINGGIVTVRGNYAAGIGGGYGGAGGTVSINGGTVTASGGLYGAGIGGGETGAGGTVTISGGKVTASGDSGGAGIGGGEKGAGGTITISGGTVTANSGECGAGIGGGENGAGGIVTISGGTVTATSYIYGAGIGGGYKGAGGTVTISGGKVTATGYESANGIGCGYSSSDTGTFSTTSKGTAIIHATSISDTTYKDSGEISAIIFVGNEGKVYDGSKNWFSLMSDFEVKKDEALTIPENVRLYPYRYGTTLTNSGMIYNKGGISDTGWVKNNGIILMIKDGKLRVSSASTGTVRYKVSAANDLPEDCSININYGNARHSTYDEEEYVASGDTITVLSSVGASVSADSLRSWVVNGEKQNTNAAETLTYKMGNEAAVIGFEMHTHDWTLVKNGDSTDNVLSQIDSILKTKYGIDDSEYEDYVSMGRGDDYTGTENYKNYQAEYKSYKEYFANYSNSAENSSYATLVCLGDNDCNVNYTYEDTALSRIGGEFKLSAASGQKFTYNADKQTPNFTLSTLDEKTGVTSLTVNDIVYKKYDNDSKTFKTVTDNEGSPVNVGTYRAELTLSGTAATENKYLTIYSDTWEITQATVTPSITGTLGKDYDGTVTINSEVKISLSGVMDADNEKVGATATFAYDSADASSVVDGKAIGATKITASDIKLTGEAKDNYVLLTDTASVGANITKATNTWNGNKPSGELKFTYGDTLKIPTYAAEFGKVEVTYKKVTAEDDGEYSNGVPTDAGSYKVRFSVAGNDNYTELSEELNLTIKPKELVPSISYVGTKAYDETTNVTDAKIALDGIVKGDENGVSATATFTYDNASATTTDEATGEKIGATKVKATGITLQGDKASNYTLTKDEADKDATITQTANVWTSEPSIKGWTYGDDANAPTFEAKFGTGTAKVEYKKKDADNKTYSEEVPKNAGNYTVRVTVPATSDYGELVSNGVDFTIAQKDISNAIVTLGTALTYNGSEQTQTVKSVSIDKMDVTYEVTGNTGKNADTYTLTVTGTGNFTGTATKEFTIEKAAEAPGKPSEKLTPEHKIKTVSDVKLSTDWQWSETDKATELADNEPVKATAKYTGADAGNYEIESVEITITRKSCEHKSGKTEVVDVIAATCTENGYTGDTVCADCKTVLETGTETSATGHKGGIATCATQAICTTCGKEYGELLDHSYTSEVTKEASDTEEGIRTYTCENCGHSYTESIPKVEPPYIEGEDGKHGWDVIRSKTDKVIEEALANPGTDNTVNVVMNGAVTVPGNIFEKIRGKDVTIIFDMGDGIKWSVDGNSVSGSDIANINLKVHTEQDQIDIPEDVMADVINNVTGVKYKKKLSLEHNGEFGFTAVMSIGLEKENAGYYANLFYYNKTANKMEFMSSGMIAEDGTANLAFTHASDYTIVIDAESLDPNAAPAEEPSTEPTTPAEKPSTEPTTPAEKPSTEPTTPAEEPSTEPTTPAEEPSTEPTTPAEEPSTEAPTTASPTTTQEPTTAAPTTTQAPTTAASTTVAPTVVTPSTAAPATEATAESPKTGDEANAPLAVLLMLISEISVVACVMLRRKKN